MIKKIWIAECDMCGKTAPARPVRGRYNDTEYELPVGWQMGHNKNFVVCHECASARSKEADRLETNAR